MAESGIKRNCASGGFGSCGLSFTPLYLELLGGVKKILEKKGMLSDEERGKIRDLEKKLEVLMRGGFVGVP